MQLSKSTLYNYETTSYEADDILLIAYKKQLLSYYSRKNIRHIPHNADKSTGKCILEIEIYLKYVGKLDVPMSELTPQELTKKERK